MSRTMQELALLAGALALLALLFAAPARAAGCRSYVPPKSSAQAVYVNANGTVTYLITKQDGDAPGQPGYLAVYDAQGTLIAGSTQGTVTVSMPKGAGTWQVKMTDVTVCGSYLTKSDGALVWVSGTPVTN